MAGVAQRFRAVQEFWGRKAGRPGLTNGLQRSTYLFSGLLRCGVCGGAITLVCGRGRNGAQRYGCALHHQRGDSVCTNGLLIRRDKLEERLLLRLQQAVLREEVIDYAVARLRDELEKRHEELNRELRNLKEEKQRIKAKSKNLVEAIAVGKDSPVVMAAITERENRIRGITNRLIEPGTGFLQEKLGELRPWP